MPIFHNLQFPTLADIETFKLSLLSVNALTLIGLGFLVDTAVAQCNNYNSFALKSEIAMMLFLATSFRQQQGHNW